MKRMVLAVVAVALAAVACAESRGGTASGGGESGRGNRGAVDRRTVDVYEAVVRAGLEDGMPARHIFIWDRLESAADDPALASEDGGGDGAGERLPAAIRRALTKALASAGKVRFVSDLDSVLTSDSRVIKQGVFVKLGPIEPAGDKVRVPSSFYWGNLAASWQTFVVANRGGDWKVTGTTGPVAMS